MSVCSIRPADVQPEFYHAVDHSADHGVDHGVEEDEGIRIGHEVEDYGQLMFRSAPQKTLAVVAPQGSYQVPSCTKICQVVPICAKICQGDECCTSKASSSS